MALLLGGFILSILAIPAWKIRQCLKASIPIWPFFLSREGRPFLLIIVLWVVTMTLMSIRVYGAYWTLSINGQYARLHYWFPRPDPVLKTSDIAEVMLIENVTRTRNGTRHSWRVALRTYTDRRYASVNLYHTVTAQRVLEPLERWTGLKHTTYRQEGFFGSPRRVAQ
jgi:hypothetical protein